MADSTKNSVLIVDDDTESVSALTDMLGQDYTVYAAVNGQDAVWIAKEYQPDVILLDILMPDIDGYETLSLLRRDEDTQHIPVVFVTSLIGVENEEKGLALGASDYISKPYKPSIVKLRIQNQIKTVNRLKQSNHLSTTDQLTGIPNRRSFNIQLNKEWGRNMRDIKPLSLMILDIDRFKDFNDTYGHQQGDEVLKILASVLMKSLRRSSDFAARWGGEEFVILLPNTYLNGAVINAERIREKIEKTPVPAPDGQIVGLTVSIGVASVIPVPDVNQNELISQADRALYTAKENGRNTVCKFDDMVCDWPVCEEF